MRDSKKNKLLSGENIFLLVLLVIGIYFFIASNIDFTGTSYKVKVFPVAISSALIILCFAEFIIKRFSKRQATKEVDNTVAENAKKVSAIQTEEEKTAKGGNQWFGFLWIAAIVFGISLVGFYITLPVFALVYLRTKKVRWLPCIIIAVAIFIIFYFGFNLVLRVHLFNGVIFGAYFR